MSRTRLRSMHGRQAAVRFSTLPPVASLLAPTWGRLLWINDGVYQSSSRLQFGGSGPLLIANRSACEKEKRQRPQKGPRRQCGQKSHDRRSHELFTARNRKSGLRRKLLGPVTAKCKLLPELQTPSAQLVQAMPLVTKTVRLDLSDRHH